MTKLEMQYWDWALRDAWFEVGYTGPGFEEARFFTYWRNDLQDFME